MYNLCRVKTFAPPESGISSMLFSRIPIQRPLRGRPPVPAPRITGAWPSQRLFTQNAQLLLVSPVKPRPQLPFLHSGVRGNPPQHMPRNPFQSQLARLLTTERKQFLKDQIKLGAKYTVIGWVFIGLFSVIAIGIQTEMDDRRYPSPPEWGFRITFLYRSARVAEEPDEKTGLTDWTLVGDTYRRLIERLEDPAVDGAGLQPILREEGDIYVQGVGKAGLDISAMAESWRRGYHHSLMGIAKAAENRDGWVNDTTRRITFPPHQVVGPSNPRPQPLHGEAFPPLEQNCEPVFDSPAAYYTKILTTHGFTSRQRLDAALAYADWLDFKGLPSTAEDMYDWGLDIAMGSLPQGISNSIDIKTGIISSNAEYVSSNMLMATTALASHHAHNSNLAAALPIFLSVLRARRQLPEAAPPPPPRKESAGFWPDVASFAKSALAPRPYPPVPPTGDEVPMRTLAAKCEEAGIMSNIGEILFASSTSKSPTKSSADATAGDLVSKAATAGHLKNQQSGLGWTREAVDLAETTLLAAKSDDEEARTRCTECLAIGMENWSTMMEQMLKDGRAAKALPNKQSQGSWFWSSGSATDEERWERESKVVHDRLRSVRKLILREEQRKQEKGLLAALFGG